MKIGISRQSLADGPEAGQGLLGQLGRALFDRGAQVAALRPDVHLFGPAGRPMFRARHNVLIIENIMLGRSDQARDEQQRLRQAMRGASAIIFAGKFGQRAVERSLGEQTMRPSVCILPGAEPADALPRRPANFLLASARWRPQKRLRTLCEAFELALEMGLDADLIVTGEPDLIVDHPRIRFRGWLGADALRHLFSQAIASVHLGWMEFYPEVMVRSVVAGCPVLYTDSGGHAEIGRDAGLAVRDKPWDFHSAYDADAPPPLYLQHVAEGMIQLKRQPTPVARRDLSAARTTRQGLAFIERLIGRTARPAAQLTG